MKAFRVVLFVVLSALMILCSCAHYQRIPPETTHTVYSVHGGEDAQLRQYAPLFLTYQNQAAYNHIGRPSAIYDGQGREQVFVDSQKPVIYYLKRSFSTKKERYTNLIYRVHFPKIPFSLIPFNLTAGKNVGLIVVITIDSRQRPVLVTTGHRRYQLLLSKGFAKGSCQRLC